MTSPLFLVDPERLDYDPIRLGGEEGWHAAAVRRIGVGEAIDLSDGHGHVARCRVLEASRADLICGVLERIDVPAPTPRLVVAQAPAKGDRAERSVELMTEVGVDEIVPWAASRSIVRWDGDSSVKALRRWRSTAREAAKQSRRAWLPVITEPATTAQLAERLTTAARAIVLHEDAKTPIGAVDPPSTGDIVLVVGPEGGIAPDELTAFAAVGAEHVSLGPTVLRTSTAAAVASGVLLSRTARWASGQ
ncbi:MAG: 16S rRNA (uracil(1498)-N(3))-methyltransferase [Jiangellaceae bacterium]|nr:16S rRNA (uracil(1498)-N(3))-methyltransferase [Jiangellaceae bacterium]